MQSTTNDDIEWDDAIAQVNRWRGECLQTFAQTETAVTETLLLLNGVALKGSSVKLPHLIGQRFEALRLATGPEGTFASEGAKAHGAISKYLVNEKLRAFLCHGIAKVTLERSGSWIVIFDLTTIRAQKCDRTRLAVTQAEAIETLQEIKRSGSKLKTELGNLRKLLPPT